MYQIQNDFWNKLGEVGLSVENAGMPWWESLSTLLFIWIILMIELLWLSDSRRQGPLKCGIGPLSSCL